MNNFKDIINVNRNAYNQLASEFNSRESDLANYKQNLKAYISRFVKENESVLEIGPGTGHLLQILENLGCRTTAIELSEKMCDLVRKNSPKTVILNQDIFTVNFCTQQFDVICALALIHTIPSREAKNFMKKVKYWLKDGGIFIFDTVIYDESKEVFVDSGEHKDVKKFRKQYTQIELEELIYSYGFKIEDLSLNYQESNSKVWMRYACRK